MNQQQELDRSMTDHYLYELAEHVLAALQMALVGAGVPVLVIMTYLWVTTQNLPGAMAVALVAIAGAFVVLDRYREGIPGVPAPGSDQPGELERL